MSKFPIQAKNDYIIVVEASQKDESKALEVVDSSPQQNYLEVLSVGQDVDSCKVGDKVLPYGQQFQGFEYKGTKYIILTDNLVLGVLND